MEALQAHPLTEPLYNAIVTLIDLFPRVMEFIIVFIAGVVFAYILKKLATFIFRLVNFDKYAYRTGLSNLLLRTAIQQSPAEFMGTALFWLLVLAVFSVAVRSLGFDYTNNLAQGLIEFIPRLIMAALIFLFGYFIASFVGRAILLALVNARFKFASLFAALLKIMMLMLFVGMSIEQLGIAHSVLIATISIAFGGLILALAIAFGLGGKDIAREILEKKFRAEQPPAEDDEISHV
jgi:hypothetical protein